MPPAAHGEALSAGHTLSSWPFWDALSRAGRAGWVTRVPCCGHSPSCPRALCSTVHPLEVALWGHGHRAGRRGPVRGHRRQELRAAPGRPLGTGSCPAPLPLCPGAAPRLCCPFPASQLQGHGCFLCQRCWISLSWCSPRPSWRGWGGGRAGTPLGSLLAVRGSAPSPKCVGGSGRCLAPGRAQPGCCDPAIRVGWAGRRKAWEAMWMCPGADAATFPDSWGAARDSALLFCPSLHIPGACNVQRKPKKPAVGGMEEGRAANPLSRLSSCGSKPLGGPSLPCSPPSARRCPAPALLLGGL